LKKSGSLLVWLFLFLGLTALSVWQIEAKLDWRYPPVNELVVTRHYSQDLGMLSSGSHRFAGDLAYIQFLQYYGAPIAGMS